MVIWDRWFSWPLLALLLHFLCRTFQREFSSYHLIISIDSQCYNDFESLTSMDNFQLLLIRWPLITLMTYITLICSFCDKHPLEFLISLAASVQPPFPTVFLCLTKAGVLLCSFTKILLLSLYSFPQGSSSIPIC